MIYFLIITNFNFGGFKQVTTTRFHTLSACEYLMKKLKDKDDVVRRSHFECIEVNDK